MNKKFKITLTVAAVLVVAGALAFVIGMSILGWDFARLDGAEYTAMNYAVQSENEVTRVELDVDSFPIEISRGDAVALDYYDASNSDVSVACENGVLTVREQYKFKPFETGLFGIGRGGRKYRLTLTDEVTASVFKGNNSNVTLIGMTLDELTVESVNAVMVLTDCNIKTLSIDSTNLTLTVKNCELGAITADSVNADVNLIDCNGGNVKIDSTNLDVVVSGSSFTEALFDGTNCGAVVKDGKCDKLTVIGTNGNYRLKNIVTDALSVRATNLDASIELIGDAEEYTVKTHGRDMPPERIGTTDKLIELSGTNNDVKLVFVDDRAL